MVEQVAGRADDKLERAVGKYFRFDDHARECVGNIGCHGCRFCHNWDASEDCRRELLKHAPAREIERIDVDGGALQRGQDMLSGERATFRQRFNRAVQHEGRIRQLAPSLACIDKQRADPAIDVDQIVASCRAGLKREFVKLVFPLGEVLGELLQHIRALVKGQTTEIFATDIARVSERLAHVDATAGGVRDYIAGDRTVHLDRILARRNPVPADEAVEFHEITLRLCAVRHM